MVKSNPIVLAAARRPQDCAACAEGFESWVLSQPALASAWSALPRASLARGETLLAAGAPARSLWFVTRGLLRSYLLDADGRERNRAFHAEGGWAGAPPAPQAVASLFTVAAIEPSELVEVPHALLLRWQAQHPPLQALLFEALAATVAMQTERETHLMLGDAAARYQRFVADQPKLAARLPLHHIASYLGITNVALSRIRARLGLVRQRSGRGLAAADGA